MYQLDPNPRSSKSFSQTLVLLGGISFVGWLVMIGMVWELAARMPLGALGPGMAWFDSGRFADFDAMGMERYWDALCLTAASDTVHIFGMWLGMTTAMMTPVAWPDLKAHFSSQTIKQTPLLVLTWLTGFLFVWVLAACVGALIQLLLVQANLLGDGLVVEFAPVGIALLFLAGVYQFTTWKTHLLSPCVAPFQCSAWTGGWQSGWQSVRCCWALMVVMFALGLMNVLAAGLLAVLMVAERSHKAGHFWAQLGGALLIAASILMILQTG